jgi:hypothetical protein
MSQLVVKLSGEPEVKSLGRNGWAKTAAIEVMGWTGGDVVSIVPITGRGNPQSCEIHLTPDAMDLIAKWWLEHGREPVEAGNGTLYSEDLSDE